MSGQLINACVLKIAHGYAQAFAAAVKHLNMVSAEA